MNSKNKEALWKQILDRVTLTEEDQALFAGQELLPVTVTTARPLETEETTLLEKLLTEKFQKPVQIQQEKVEPKVVGGVLVQYGDHVFDATMQRQLEKMDALMKEIHLQDQDGKDWFGVGMSHNINLAPLKGILSAINRAVKG